MTCPRLPIAPTKWEHILRQVLNLNYRAKVYAASSANDYVTLVNEAAKDLFAFGVPSFAIAVGGEFDLRPEPLRPIFGDQQYFENLPTLANETPGKTLLRCCAKRFVPSRFEWVVFGGRGCSPATFVITHEVPESPLDRDFDRFEKTVYEYGSLPRSMDRRRIAYI